MTVHLVTRENGETVIINHDKKRDSMIQVTVSVLKIYLKGIEILHNKKDGLYPSRSELFRVMVRDKLIKLEGNGLTEGNIKIEDLLESIEEKELDLGEIVNVDILDEITGETFKIETTVLGNKEDWLKSKEFRKKEPMDKMIYGGGNKNGSVRLGDTIDDSNIDPDIVIARGRQTKYNSRGIMDEYYNGGL